MFGRKIADKLIILSIIILAANLILRLVNQSQMMWNFPLDGTDWSTHLFELWAFDKYGFHGMVLNWYNGYELFKFYTPGWYFFTLPFYWIFKKVEIAGFISVVALFIAGFAGTYILGKTNKFSRKQIILFFLLFFGNALSIANFIRNGRVTELLGWVIFTFLVATLFYFNDKPLDFRFFLAFVPLFAVFMLAHFTELITFGLLFLGFLIVKPLKEKFFAVASAGISAVVTSFWWWPMLRDFKSSYISELYYSSRLLNMTFIESMLVTGVASAFLLAFYFYLKSAKDAKKEFLLFSPILVFNILFLLRLTPYIPVLDRIYPHPAITFLLFFTLFFIFKSDWQKFKLYNVIALFLVMIAAGSVMANIADTDTFYVHDEPASNAIDILSHVTERYAVLNPVGKVYPIGLYSYGPVYFNLNAMGGWMPTAISAEYYAESQQLKKYIANEDCSAMKIFQQRNTTEVIAFGSKCDYLEKCALTEVYSNEIGCLYEL